MIAVFDGIRNSGAGYHLLVKVREQLNRCVIDSRIFAVLWDGRLHLKEL